MNIYIVGGLGIICMGVVGYFYGQVDSNSGPSERYVKSSVYKNCERDYIKSASHLGFSASKKQCKCFDSALQKLTPAQSKAAYKTLEDRLTLAFMGLAGAKVGGNNVSIQDDFLGTVSTDVKMSPRGTTIIKQCGMF